MVYSSYTYKSLGLFLALCVSHVTMPAKFELLLLSIFTVINHTCDIMPSFVIYVLGAIFHI